MEDFDLICIAMIFVVGILFSFSMPFVGKYARKRGLNVEVCKCSFSGTVLVILAISAAIPMFFYFKTSVKVTWFFLVAYWAVMHNVEFPKQIDLYKDYLDQLKQIQKLQQTNEDLRRKLQENQTDGRRNAQSNNFDI